jgi:anti-sigma factor RsiW
MHQPIATTTVEMRRCLRCLEEKTIDQFRRKSRTGTGRHRQCNQCHAEYERERRARRKSNRNRRDVKQHLTRLNRARDLRDCARVSRLMLDQFGGIEGLAAAVAEVRQAGGMPLVRLMTAYLKLQFQMEIDQRRSEQTSA